MFVNNVAWNGAKAARRLTVLTLVVARQRAVESADPRDRHLFHGRCTNTPPRDRSKAIHMMGINTMR